MFSLTLFNNPSTLSLIYIYIYTHTHTHSARAMKFSKRMVSKVDDAWFFVEKSVNGNN
jgi:hypothetical protein